MAGAGCSTLTETSGSAGGWSGDRLTDGRVILFLPPGSGGVGELASDLKLELHVAPNPGRGVIRIRCALAAPERVSLKLYDVTGKLVATLARGRLRAGVSSFELPDFGPAQGPVPAAARNPGLPPDPEAGCRVGIAVSNHQGLVPLAFLASWRFQSGYAHWLTSQGFAGMIAQD